MRIQAAQLTAMLAVAVLAIAGCRDEKESTSPVDTSAYAGASYTESHDAETLTALRFTDVTEAAGIAFEHVTGAFGKKWMPETMGSGGGFLDYDSDGYPDLFLVNCCQWPGREDSEGRSHSALFRNRGDGTFEDVTTQAGLNITLYGMGCAFADYDGDGDPDIYLTAVGPNRLLRNDNGRFVDVTEEAGVDGNAPDAEFPSWSTSAAWLDYDRDGWVDLFVCNYVKWTPETDIFTTIDGKTKSYATPQQYEGDSCRLYRNINGMRFEDVTVASGVFNNEGKSMGVAVEDFNDDGWPDLVVANDTQPNFLYINRADSDNPGFVENGIAAGLGKDEAGRARAGMGIDIADYGNNGRLGVIIGNFSREPLSLYTQLDDTLFQDQAGRARLTRKSLLPLTFGVLFGDFDNDGFLDLAVGNGHIEPEINNIQREITYAQPPQLFLNDGQGLFIDASDHCGEPFQVPIVSRGLATADIDRDGDLDLLLTTNGGKPCLLRNDLPPDAPRAALIRLRGSGPNTGALGARVVAQTGEIVQRRYVRTGSSYLAQSEEVIAIGVGQHGKVDGLTIHWPDGSTGRYENLVSGKVVTIRQDQSALTDASGN